MFDLRTFLFIFITVTLTPSFCLIPPKFQWKTMDFAWEGNTRERAMAEGSFIPENNMPTGIARWQDKLFITIPRWKKGVPASLNYINVNGGQQQPLIPYPSWHDAFVSARACCAPTNSTVVSAFRVSVDSCDRLWVVDNGVSDMAGDVKQIADPAILVFDLKTDTLVHKYVFSDDQLKESSVLTSIVVDDAMGCGDTFAYVTDMGSNALIVFSLRANQAWRVEHPYFHFDPSAGLFHVGGIDFFWSDGVSSATLSRSRSDGSRDLYLHPTSSTKQFKISTSILKNKDAAEEERLKAVTIVGDRGLNSQVTACDLDLDTNILFFTQLNKNGVGCWNVDTPFAEANTPLIISDCNLLEFPNDVKVDSDRNIWILSDRQSKFLYEAMDFNQVNFRIMTAPVSTVIEGSACVPREPKKDSSKESLKGKKKKTSMSVIKENSTDTNKESSNENVKGNTKKTNKDIQLDNIDAGADKEGSKESQDSKGSKGSKRKGLFGKKKLS